MVDQSAVKILVEKELEKIEESSLRNYISENLIEPRCEDRDWDYGKEGEKYPCWIVLEGKESNTGIAYCESGFGPECPWGLLFLSGENLSMGMDAGWYRDFESAFRESFMIEEYNKSAYSTRGGSAPTRE